MSTRVAAQKTELYSTTEVSLLCRQGRSKKNPIGSFKTKKIYFRIAPCFSIVSLNDPSYHTTIEREPLIKDPSAFGGMLLFHIPFL